MKNSISDMLFTIGFLLLLVLFAWMLYDIFMLGYYRTLLAFLGLSLCWIGASIGTRG